MSVMTNGKQAKSRQQRDLFGPHEKNCTWLWCLSVRFSECVPWDFLLCFKILTLESSRFLSHSFQDGCLGSGILSSQPTFCAKGGREPRNASLSFLWKQSFPPRAPQSRPPGQGWVTWPSPPEEAAADSFPPRVKDGLREGRSRWFQFGSLQKWFIQAATSMRSCGHCIVFISPLLLCVKCAFWLSDFVCLRCVPRSGLLGRAGLS